MVNPVVFKKNAGIGTPDAEADSFLQSCFVDLGDLRALMDCTNSQCIVLGRTGAGKTALLKQLAATSDHVAELPLEALALNYVANSKAIEFYEAAGAHMEAFYKTLWQHILVIELLKLRYKIRSDQDQETMFSRLLDRLGNDRAKTQAMDYMKEYGGKFWRETAERTKSITDKVERELKASGKAELTKISLGAEGAKKLSTEEKREVVEFGERAVGELQIEKLHQVIRLLSDDIFQDSSNHYYIVIDRLDESWALEKMRYKLIRALIEAVRSLRQIQNVKIVFALRDDLLQTVLDKTASPGFQREKYTSLYLRVKWRNDEIVTMLTRRVNELYKRQYSGETVSLSEVLPSNQINRVSMTEYLIQRTLYRPRDAIVFFNECLAQAAGKSRMTKEMVLGAEGVYSDNRMSSLIDEWGRDFPLMRFYFDPLRKSKTPAKISDISDESINSMCVRILEAENPNDPMTTICEKFYILNKMNRLQFAKEWLSYLYSFGAVGMKVAAWYPRMWSFLHTEGLPTLDISDGSSFFVHRMLWRTLGVEQRSATTGDALAQDWAG